MIEMNPSFLLRNPEVISPVAPWCVVLDNLELGVVVLAQPWLAGEGLRRAELERQLERLATDLPLGGPIYFQRVKRAVARLESLGALEARGSGRGQRFVTRPEGFAAFLLNLRVPATDPTLDGSEFELKRALVAMWNLTLERTSQLDPPDFSVATEPFLERLESLEVLGRRVIDFELLRTALDVLQLIATERRHVEKLLATAERRLVQVEAQAKTLASLDLTQLAAGRLPPAAAALLEAAPEGALSLVRELATAALPGLHLRASIERYRHYLDYLDTLARLHAAELRTIDLDAVRHLTRGGRS